MELKYVIVEDRASELELPIVFSNILFHNEVARSYRVISAGFVEMDHEGNVVCYGESISCKVKSRGEKDTAMLQKHIFGKRL